MKVERVEAIRVGFNGRAMVEAAARGRQHDHNAVARIEVTVSSESAGDFSNIRAVQDLILRELVKRPIERLHGAQVRQKSATFRRDGKWMIIFEVG